MIRACRRHGARVTRNLFPRPIALKKSFRHFIEVGEEIAIPLKGGKLKGTYSTSYERLIPGMKRRYQQATGVRSRAHYQRFLTNLPCPTREGRRLRKEALAVEVGGRGIHEISSASVAEADSFFSGLTLEGNRATVGEEILKEIRNRLKFLLDVGLSYLTLDRSGPTLSGGEAQRIRLASQVGSELTGVLYVLDEPSIGLHPVQANVIPASTASNPNVRIAGRRQRQGQ